MCFFKTLGRCLAFVCLAVTVHAQIEITDQLPISNWTVFYAEPLRWSTPKGVDAYARMGGAADWRHLPKAGPQVRDVAFSGDNRWGKTGRPPVGRSHAAWIFAPEQPFADKTNAAEWFPNSTFYYFLPNRYGFGDWILNQARKRSFSLLFANRMGLPQFFTQANSVMWRNGFSKKSYTNTPVKPLKGLLSGQKIHSWSISPSVSTPSLAIRTTNSRKDVSTAWGGSLNRNEGWASTYSAKADILRYFPVFTFGVSGGQRQAAYYSKADSVDVINFNERLAEAGVSLPLRWLNGHFTTILCPSVGFDYRALSDVRAEGRPIQTDPFGTLNLGLRVAHLSRSLYPNSSPRAGVDAAVTYNKSLNGSFTERVGVAMALYLPGLLPNHNVKLKGGYQQERLGNLYQYADEFEYTRGYSVPVNDGVKAISLIYGLPLGYPDFKLRRLLTLNRVRTNFFYDAAWANSRALDRNIHLASTGFELLFDVRLMKALRISLGARHAWLLEKDTRYPGRNTRLEFFTTTEL